MSEPAVLSLGSVNADFQVRTPRLLQAGETLLAHRFSRLAGGKAANVAFLARRLDHPAFLLGRVGADELAAQVLQPLQQAGVDLHRVTVAPVSPTAVAMIAVAPNGKKTIVLAANANDDWDAPAIRSAMTAIAAAPAGSVLAADCEIAPDALRRCIGVAHGCGLPVVLDPAPASRTDAGLLARCTALTPDAGEAGELSGIDASEPAGAAHAATALARHGVPLVCVKLAGGGCVATHDGRITHIPPVPVEVVDSTGAGDAFTGALAVALLRHCPVDEAVLFATAAAHHAVTGWGSQEAYPDDAQIRPLMQRLAAGRHDIA